ncbi:MAG: HEAT repeat domain-containing protein [Planctomycetaceae bacterium]|nr:HEAT repeat domain-containing protein [Planctomycetaceae bacterium]
MNLSKYAAALLAVLLGWAGGCTPPQKDLASQFQSADPQARIEAIREAGRTKDPAAVPFLIDRLSDSQSDIRLFAIMALRDITGQVHGYEVYAPAPQRAAAIERWRAWLARRSGGNGPGSAMPGHWGDGHSGAATRPATGAP